MAGTISVNSSYSVNETQTAAKIKIYRTGDLSGTVTVYYQTGSQSAIGGFDFTQTTGSVTLKKNHASATVTVPVTNDTLAEGPESFSFNITNVVNGVLGFPRTATVNIVDDESPSAPPPPPPPPPPTLQVTSQQVLAGLDSPISFDWAPNDPAKMVIAEKSGLIKVFGPNGQVYPLLDLRPVVNDSFDRGLLDIELHPNFSTQPYLYAYYAVDPPETANFVAGSNQGPDGGGNRYAQLVRYTVGTDPATGRLTCDPGTGVVLLGGAGDSLSDISGAGAVDSTSNLSQRPSGINTDGTNVQDYIAIDSRSHAAGALEFGPGGLLYVTVGDGASFNFADPRAVRVQDTGNLSGKVLRIDALTGDGVAANPFYDGNPDSNLSKVYALGLRNAFRAGFDRDGDLFLGDVGWNAWEEIDTGGAGSNFGWPYYEGGQGGVSLQTFGYKDMQAAKDFYASGKPVVAPFQAFSHQDSAPGFPMQAIVFGDIYTGSIYPAWLQDRAFVASLTTGEVFAVSTTNPAAAVEKLTTYAGTIVFMDQGPDGLIYFANLTGGQIGRWQISSPAADLRLDRDPDRIGSTDLSGATVAGNIYVFLGGDVNGVQQVEFRVDNRTVSIDRSAPWDLVGGTASAARPFDTTTLANGSHSVSAIVTYSSGQAASVTDSFFVSNPSATALPGASLRHDDIIM